MAVEPSCMASWAEASSRGAPVLRKSDLATSAFNLLTRASMLASKAFLSIFIVRQMSLDEFGLFSLILATATITTYLLGLDLYTISSREIPGAPPKAVRGVVQTQLATHLVCYGAGLAGFYPLFWFGFLPREHLATVCAILLLEHLTQETFRWLIALERHVTANLVQFIKSALWVGTLLLVPQAVSLRIVVQYWLAALVVSSALGLGALVGCGAIGPPPWRLRWASMVANIRQAGFFLACTISTLVLNYSNRYFLKYYTGEDRLVGAFSLFASLANVMEVAAGGAVIQTLLPKVIGSHRQRQQNFAATLQVMNAAVLACAVAAATVLWLGVSPLLGFLRQEELLGYLPCFYLLLGAAFLSTVTLIPYNVLYILRRDRIQMTTSLTGMLLNVVLNVLLIPRWPMWGPAVSLLASKALIGGLKSRALKGTPLGGFRALLPGAPKWEMV